MSGVKEIRKLLGLTQEQLAGYLGISRSMVNLIELDLRELENSKYLRLIDFAELHKHEEKPIRARPIEKQQWVKEEETRHFQKMDAHTKRCRFKVEVLEEKLAKMEKQEQQLISWLQTVQQRLASLPKTPEHEQERKWLDIEQTGAPLKLRECGKVEQSKLRRKVLLMRAEVEVGEGMARRSVV